MARRSTTKELGMQACKDGIGVDDLPANLSTPDARKQWREGWYDQHFGQKWEPKDAQIHERVWPVHI